MNRKVSFDTRQADLHNPVQGCRLKKLNPDMGAAGAQQNHLLSALPAEILVRLSLNMELVSMPLGEVVCESSSQLHYVYFPTTAILSCLLYTSPSPRDRQKSRM